MRRDCDCHGWIRCCLALCGDDRGKRKLCSLRQCDGTTAGAKSNGVTIASTQGGTGNTSNASTTVIAPPVLSGSFSTSTLLQGGSATLTYTVSNPNTGSGLSGIDLRTRCLLASLSPRRMGSAAHAAAPQPPLRGSSSIALSGATLSAAATCTVAVNVTGTATGMQTNVTGAITSNEGGNGSASTTVIQVAGTSFVLPLRPSGRATPLRP